MCAITNLPISRKLAAAFAAVIVVVFVGGAIIYTRLGVLEEATDWRVHTAQVLATVDAMTKAILDQQSGVRGYLATGDASFLRRYRSGGDAYALAFRNAKALTADNPAQQRRLDQLTALAQVWRGVAAREIALMATPQTREQARALADTRASRTSVRLIRANADEIEATELRLMAQRAAVQKQAYATAYTATILGAAASLGVAMLMAMLLTRGVTVPIRRMTGAMAALAHGNTGVHVPGVGRTDEIGAMAASVQVFRDSMIDRDHAERALQESEEKWRAVFENNPTMYFMVDEAGTVLSVNPFGAEQLGYPVDELVGDTVAKVLHEADRAAAQRNMAACIEQRGQAMSWELRKVRKDGSMLWVRETAKAVLMQERPVVLVVCEDITERKWAEDLTAQVFETSPDGVVLIGRDYCYQRVNPAYVRLLGMPAQDIVGRHIADVRGGEHFERTVRHGLDRCFAGEEIRFSDWFTFARWSYVAVSYSPLRRGSEQVESVLAIVRDLTDHMQAAEALQAAQAELAHANRVTTMGQLTAAIAHEVNQPIAAAVTNANAALRWLGAQPPDMAEAKQAIGRIIENGQRASDVIGGIRALMKKTPPRKERFDLNEAVLNVVSITKSEMLRHGVTPRAELAEDLPALEGDRIQLQQVILNLIVNAIEAMSGSGVDAGARVLFIGTERERGSGARVTVRDSGPGLDAKSMARVFEAFHTTKPTGLGLGLAICHSIIKAHGGELWASANEPRGAVFQFTVPSALDETVPAEHAGQMSVVRG